MEFSKITTVEVRNFMCFSHEIATYDETNILNFKGFNGMGKSAILKAIAVCLMNVYSHKQADFIKYGEDYFRVIVSFDDGVKILRDKYINGQSLYEMYRDGELVYSTKVGNKLTRVTDVPDIIKNYLALIEIGNSGTGYLNFQTRKEPLWLTETTGSENYTSLNVILKSGEISRASALINSDKNELNSAITELERDKQTVESTLMTAKAFTPVLLSALNEKEQQVKDLTRRASSFNEIVSIVNELMQIRVSPEIEPIRDTRYQSILSISSLLLEIESIEEIPNIELLEAQKLSKSQRLLSLCKELDILRSLPKVERVSLDRATAIAKIVSLSKDVETLPRTVGTDILTMDEKRYNAILKIAKEAVDVKTVRQEHKNNVIEIIEVEGQLKEIVEDASKHGMRFIRCNNCGSYMRVSVGGGQNG